MEKAKLVVIGGSGLLGNKIAAAAFGEFKTVATSWKHKTKGSFKDVPLDITDEKSVRNLIGKRAPNIVVHTAAMTNVDACEDDPERAFEINAKGTENIAYACEEAGAKLVYISTDYVFDGKKGSYSEDDVPNPISRYGASKLEGEKAVEKACSDYIIGRVSVLYGWNPRKPNFATWVIDSLQKGQQINIVTDQYASPTFADSTARTLLEMCGRDLKGVFHISGRERISRYAFALKVAEVFGYEKGLITPVKTEAIAQKARRPKDSSLNVGKVEKTLGTKLYDVEQGLKEMRDKR